MSAVVTRKIVCDVRDCPAEVIDQFPRTSVGAFRVELTGKGWVTGPMRVDLCPEHAGIKGRLSPKG